MHLLSVACIMDWTVQQAYTRPLQEASYREIFKSYKLRDANRCQSFWHLSLRACKKAPLRCKRIHAGRSGAYSFMYLLRTPSNALGWKRPFTISRLWPSKDPLVPSSASRNCCTCSGWRFMLLFSSMKFVKTVFLVPSRATCNSGVTSVSG